MNFSNNKIDPDTLPQVQDIRYDTLEPGYRKVIWVENGIISFLLLTAFGIAFYFEKLDFLVSYVFFIFIALCLVLLIITWIRLKRFSCKGYQVRQHDLVYKSGLWWRSEVAIPFVRVQHSEVTQGPIARWMGYSTLNLFTAGGSQSDLSIPALLPERAEKLKAYIAQKSIEDEAVI